MTHKSKFLIIPEELEYWHEPTKEEIRFGHGAIHHRMFSFDKCFDEDGNLKLKVRATDDKLIYYYACDEFSNSRLYKLQKIEP
jgi:hypothetical protein